jgi:1,4-dihydroxy-6-naphthoate synthase
MSPRPLRVGISTCPNDTFVFHGLLTGAVAVEGAEVEIELADIEALNRKLAAGELDAAKASFAAALPLAGEVVLLASGAAVGFGVGPVALAPPRGVRAPSRTAARILSPGAGTTAALLWRIFHGGEVDLVHVRFSEIMPALARGEADLGLCIHEGRFTYASHGLTLVEDLGATWERATGAPLPLGGVFARREIGRERARALAAAVRRSLDLARARPSDALATMRRHAQEHTDEVIWRHVELYVTAETRELSRRARAAIVELGRRAAAAGAAAARVEFEVAEA